MDGVLIRTRIQSKHPKTLGKQNLAINPSFTDYSCDAVTGKVTNRPACLEFAVETCLKILEKDTLTYPN